MLARAVPVIRCGRCLISLLALTRGNQLRTRIWSSKHLSQHSASIKSSNEQLNSQFSAVRESTSATRFKHTLSTDLFDSLICSNLLRSQQTPKMHTASDTRNVWTGPSQPLLRVTTVKQLDLSKLTAIKALAVIGTVH